MKYCYNCGRRLESDAAVCTSCGKSVTELPIDGQAKHCAYCGGIIDKAFDLCLSCGRKVKYVPLQRDTNVKDSLGKAAKVLLVVACVITGLVGVACTIIGLVLAYGMAPLSDAMLMVNLVMWIFGMLSLVSLGWRIPLTAHVFDRIKRGREIATSAKVLILLFVGLVSGILLLCRREPR